MKNDNFDMKPSFRRAAKPRASAFGKPIKILAVGFIIAAVLSIVLVFSLVRNLAAAWSGTGLPSWQISGGGDVESDSTPGGIPTAVLLEDMPEPWTGSERVTILLMGLDFRDWERDEGPPRTDSMILVTLDPVSETAGMLSIPRDLWVEIPAYGHGRINTAYYIGEQDRLPGGGPSLAVKTVEKFLGVPIQYYVQLDFGAFVRMVDEIGGVELNVPEEIRVDPIGPNNTVFLEPGVQVLSGEVTLGYARNRKTEGGDFDRAERQQQVAFAIKEQILKLDTLPMLIAKAPILYQELASGIHTNLTLDQMISLGLLAVRMPADNVNRGVIAPPNNVTLETVQYGGKEAEVLKPVPDQIRLLRDEIFTATGAIGPSIPVDDHGAASDQEHARLSVLNGAGEPDLAINTTDLLRGLGFNVVEASNADRFDYPQTRVIDYTGNPYTTQYLMDLMDLTQSQILFQSLPDSQIDVALIMGYDWYDILLNLSEAQN